ncbi:MAG: M24 family metallopeptidase [Methanoregulaceae archaeon]|nr:M24 family metallopeptidase [Methanoregulaceae archaeon]
MTIDLGAVWDGYCSDITRTFALGSVAPERAHIYEIVKEANQAGREIAKPGIRAGDIDSAARSLIDQAGYAHYFTHRTGHGLGLDIHENPYLFLENDLKLSISSSVMCNDRVSRYFFGASFSSSSATIRSLFFPLPWFCCFPFLE